jgi:predicted permease
MDTLLQDLRYAGRMLRRSPGFTIAAALSLALGIGANTAIFSLVNAVLFARLPVEAPERLVRLYTSDARNPGYNATSFPNYRDYRAQASSVLADVAAYDWAPLSLASGGEPEFLFGQIVTANYFDVLGVRPALGRGFLPDEDQHSVPVAVLSHGLWQRRFGSDPGIVGRNVEMNGMAFTVVGIAPAAFTGLDVGARPELWLPMGLHARVITNDAEAYDDRRTLQFNVFGRLRDGVGIEQAAAAVKTVGERLAAAYPAENKDRYGTLVPLGLATLDGDTRQMARLAAGVLMTVVAFVLLIACANVANLLLGRASARRREVAVRLSLGATRGRLVRQMLTESALLSTVAGVLGLLVGSWGYALLLGLRPESPVAFDLTGRLDPRVLAFTLAVAVASGVLFGLVPALQATRAELASDLKERGEGSGGRAGNRVRNTLVVSQVALSLVALAGASLFARSLDSARRLEPGFDAERLALASVHLGAQGYSQERGLTFYREALERVGTLPGVESAALATHVALVGGGFGRTVFPEGVTGDVVGTFVNTDAVTPHFFETVGTPVLRGRTFAETDREGAPRVAIVNEAMAKRFWPDADPIGRRFHFFGTEPYEVIGIAKDSAQWNIGEAPRPCAYVALAQNYSPYATLHVRGARPQLLLAPLRAELRRLDERLPIFDVTTFARQIETSLWAPRMAAGLLAAFGTLALTIAAVGLYGVMAFTVARRTREIGLRMALGAAPRDVLRMILGRGLALALGGIAIGTGAAALLARASRALLYSPSPFDLATFGLVPLTLVAAALLASYLPARRAMKVDPMIALRCE